MMAASPHQITELVTARITYEHVQSALGDGSRRDTGQGSYPPVSQRHIFDILSHPAFTFAYVFAFTPCARVSLIRNCSPVMWIN